MSPALKIELVARSSLVRPGSELPLAIALTNDADQPLRGAKAELTLEVERGVLISWDLDLAEVPAGATLPDARRATEPAWHLPHNVAAGDGQFRLRCYSADGAMLGEAALTLPVTGSTSPS